MPEARPALLRALKRERLHVEPRILESSPPHIRRRFAHVWAPADLFLAQLAAWPPGLLAFWLGVQGGHIVFTAGPSTYLPSAVPWHQASLQGVARLSLTDLVEEPRRTLEVAAHLVDHLLGSRCATDAPWLSDGAGATAQLGAVARQTLPLIRLGYGPAEPHAYFAWAFAGYWLDRQALNVADPLVERLLHTTLYSETFWRAETANGTNL